MIYYTQNNLVREMSLFQKYVDVFYNWDRQFFRSLHHEDFMFIRETELLMLDDHKTVIDELASKREMDWHTKATLSHKD